MISQARSRICRSARAHCEESNSHRIADRPILCGLQQRDCFSFERSLQSEATTMIVACAVAVFFLIVGSNSPFRSQSVDCNSEAMLKRSFTGLDRFCLQPKYRSVVCTEAWPNRNWICSSSPPLAWHNFAQVRRRSCGATLSNPIFPQ